MGWPDAPPIEIYAKDIIANPYNRAPLSAVIKVQHADLVPSQIVRMEVTVEGQHQAQDLVADLYPESESFETNFDMRDLLQDGEVGIPVLGLYPSSENRVRFRLGTETRLFTGEATVRTRLWGSTKGETVVVSIADTARPDTSTSAYRGGRIDLYHPRG